MQYTLVKLWFETSLVCDVMDSRGGMAVWLSCDSCCTPTHQEVKEGCRSVTH